MNILTNVSLFLSILILLIGCRASEFYTLKELRKQNVPEALKNKVWTLTGIGGTTEPAASIGAAYRSPTNSGCMFTFVFAEKGDLSVTFRGTRLMGTYLIEGDRFKHINGGWRDKIVWNTNPECSVTPTELAYIFDGDFQFRLDHETLVLINSRGDSFTLSSKT